jgi:hypothetical protein
MAASSPSPPLSPHPLPQPRGRTCVSAALPERHTYIRSWMAVILSETRLATYEPVDVRESAPMTTPPSNDTAMMVVCGRGGARGRGGRGVEGHASRAVGPSARHTRVDERHTRARESARPRVCVRARRTPESMPPVEAPMSASLSILVTRGVRVRVL